MGYIGLPRHLAEWIGPRPDALLAARSALMVFYIVLGCFLDGISMVVLTMGVILPTIQKAGIDLIWFGIFVVVVVEMAQITPPVGFNLFVLQGMTGKQLPWIARTAMPAFFLLMVAAGFCSTSSRDWSPGCRNAWSADATPARPWRWRADARIRRSHRFLAQRPSHGNPRRSGGGSP
jgi:hypothetical protein